MFMFLGIMGLLAFFVGVVYLLINVFRRKTKKIAGLIMLIGFVSFVVGVSVDTSGSEKDTAATTEKKEVVKVEKDKNNKPEKQKKASEPKARDSKAEDKQTDIGIGEKLKVGKVEYIVNEVTSADNVGGDYGKKPQGIYLIINVTVTNRGDESLSISDSFFNLLNDGKKFDSDSLAAVYANRDGQSFFVNDINPDSTLTSNVVFDVSQKVIDSQSKQLELKTGYWGTEKGLINLK